MSSAAEEYVSPTQAALMLGVARGTMYTLIARGELRSVKIAGRLLLVRAEVAHLAKTRAARSSARSGKQPAHVGLGARGPASTGAPEAAR